MSAAALATHAETCTQCAGAFDGVGYAGAPTGELCGEGKVLIATADRGGPGPDDPSEASVRRQGDTGEGGHIGGPPEFPGVAAGTAESYGGDRSAEGGLSASPSKSASRPEANGRGVEPAMWRLAGCECPANAKPRERCGGKWIRCNGRLEYTRPIWGPKLEAERLAREAKVTP